MWGEGVPDPVLDIQRAPGDTDKRRYNLATQTGEERGPETFKRQNTIGGFNL